MKFRVDHGYLSKSVTKKQLGTAVVVAILCLMGGRIVDAQGPTSEDRDLLADAVPAAADFPTYDDQLWWMLRKGLVRKVAARRLAEGSNTPETVGLLLEGGRIADALRVIRTIVERHPEHIARTFKAVSERGGEIYYDQSRDFAVQLYGLIDAARLRLAKLPREEAARAERELLWNDGRRLPGEPQNAGWTYRSRRFVQEYAGTEAALVAEVDLIRQDTRLSERLTALDAFARRHDGTAAAAKALYEKASVLSSARQDGKTGKEEDPTDRFMEVLEIVRQLESGRYPRCEWVDRAPSLVVLFSAYEPVYAPANVERVFDAFVEFAVTHFALLNPRNPIADTLGYFLTSRAAQLWTHPGDRIGGVERMLFALEKVAPDRSAVAYLRALYYIRTVSWERNADRSTCSARREKH